MCSYKHQNYISTMVSNRKQNSEVIKIKFPVYTR